MPHKVLRARFNWWRIGESFRGIFASYCHDMSYALSPFYDNSSVVRLVLVDSGYQRSFRWRYRTKIGQNREPLAPSAAAQRLRIIITYGLTSHPAQGNDGMRSGAPLLGTAMQTAQTSSRSRRWRAILGWQPRNATCITLKPWRTTPLICNPLTPA